MANEIETNEVEFKIFIKASLDFRKYRVQVESPFSDRFVREFYDASALLQAISFVRGVQLRHDAHYKYRLPIILSRFSLGDLVVFETDIEETSHYAGSRVAFRERLDQCFKDGQELINFMSAGKS